MIKQDLEDSNGGRTVVGIDPCSESRLKKEYKNAQTAGKGDGNDG